MTDETVRATVRDAVIGDRDAVLALATMMAITFVPEPDAFDATYRSVLGDPHAYLLVADVDGRVGAYLLAFEHPAFFANGAVAWVEEIAVRDDLRRRGIGTRLMTAYEESVGGRGGRLVALATTRADAFYDALGYTGHATYYRKLLG